MVVSKPDTALKVIAGFSVVVPTLPSIIEAGILTDTVGIASSLVIVPIAVAVASVAPVGALNVMVSVSSASYVFSPVTGTSIVPLVAPAAMVNVPEVAV